MTLAYQFATLSRCQRRQVGCVIVRGNNIVMAYNGTPPGEDNCCEDAITSKTKSNVIHAEINALKKIPKNIKLHHAWLFVTLSPCVDCANYIIQRGVGTVVYDVVKNTNIGIPTLIKNKIVVHQLSP